MRPEKVAESRKGHPITDSRVGLFQIHIAEARSPTRYHKFPIKTSRSRGLKFCVADGAGDRNMNLGNVKSDKKF